MYLENYREDFKLQTKLHLRHFSCYSWKWSSPYLSFFALIAMFAFNINGADACVGHDGNCQGANGYQGNCCGGMHCQKNDPSWAEGRCYYNPGK